MIHCDGAVYQHHLWNRNTFLRYEATQRDRQMNMTDLHPRPSHILKLERTAPRWLHARSCTDASVRRSGYMYLRLLASLGGSLRATRNHA